MWIHAWRVGQLSHWLDSARGEQDNAGVLELDEAELESTEEVVEIIAEETVLDIPPPVTEDDAVELVDLD